MLGNLGKYDVSRVFKGTPRNLVKVAGGGFSRAKDKDDQRAHPIKTQSLPWPFLLV
jgi:hypothetical protein